MKITARSATIAAIAAFALVPATALGAAKETYTSVTSSVSSGPTDCNQIHILKIGPSTAKTVLVMIPGYLGGSGDFRVIGQRLTTRFKKLQVWGVDRRSQCLEDSSAFVGGTPTQQLGYYILGQAFGGTTFSPAYVNLTSTSSPGAEAARTWGLATTMADIHAVVLAAKAGGRKVILGGHSLGGSLTDIYATWDFNGTAGYKDVAGLVLVDGGARGTLGAAPDQTKVNADISALASGNPFSSLLPGIPVEDQGIFPELAGQYAIKAAKANSALQSFLGNVGMGAFTRPTSSGKLNNEAGLGFAFDRDTSPALVGLLHMNMGHLKESTNGGAASWTDGGLTDLKDAKTLWGTEPGNSVEWYFPKRLGIDVGAATALTQSSFTDGLGIRTWHLADVNIPLYAFETGLTCSDSVLGDGQGRPLPTDSGFAAWVTGHKTSTCGVLVGAQSFKIASKITKSTFTSDHDQEHLDPLVARATSNKFQTTLVTFLKSLKVS
ncbi:MAG: alpha/beta fold hydrolase [Actinomycetes bacterium]